MTFEEAMEKCVADGAIRSYCISENLAFVYRIQDAKIQARGIYGIEGKWKLGERLVSSKNYAINKGWHTIRALPWQAKAIESDAAKYNPGYANALFQQCYTCKETKASNLFSHLSAPGKHARDWECDQCFERRMREIDLYKSENTKQDGDNIEKEQFSPLPSAEHQI